MPKAEEFRQYADEAMRWARTAKTEQEREGFLELARTWIMAALHRASAEPDQKVR